MDSIRVNSRSWGNGSECKYSPPPTGCLHTAPVEAPETELPAGVELHFSSFSELAIASPETAVLAIDCYHGVKAMANTLVSILETASTIAKGMSVTLKEMMSPTVTENYPDEPPKFEERFRGVHVLQRDVNGLEKCVACFLCAAARPPKDRGALPRPSRLAASRHGVENVRRLLPFPRALPLQLHLHRSRREH